MVMTIVNSSMCQVTQFNVPVAEAWKVTNSEGNIRGLYARVRRWREKEEKNDTEMAASGLVSLSFQQELQETPSSLSSGSARSSSTNNNMMKNRRDSTSRELLPQWMDPEKTIAAMSKRPKRRQEEVAREENRKKLDNHQIDNKYSRAFKAVTLKLKENQSNPDLYGKRGYGIRSVVQEINTTMLSSPNDKQLSKSAIKDAISRGSFGISPVRRGRPSIVPHQLTYALATHSTMMQVSGEGEASAMKMKSVAAALTSGTDHENEVDLDYLWRKTRLEHPEIIYPVTAKNHEDRQVDWLTYKNIIEWNSCAKKFLVDIGMAEDRPGVIRVYSIFFVYYIILANLLTFIFMSARK